MKHELVCDFPHLLQTSSAQYRCVCMIAFHHHNTRAGRSIKISYNLTIRADLLMLFQSLDLRAGKKKTAIPGFKDKIVVCRKQVALRSSAGMQGFVGYILFGGKRLMKSIPLFRLGTACPILRTIQNSIPIFRRVLLHIPLPGIILEAIAHKFNHTSRIYIYSIP